MQLDRLTLYRIIGSVAAILVVTVLSSVLNLQAKQTQVRKHGS